MVLEEPSQFSMGQTAQSLTCPSWRNHILGWMTDLNMPLSCFREKMSGRPSVLSFLSRQRALRCFAAAEIFGQKHNNALKGDFSRGYNSSFLCDAIYHWSTCSSDGRERMKFVDVNFVHFIPVSSCLSKLQRQVDNIRVPGGLNKSS